MRLNASACCSSDLPHHGLASSTGTCSLLLAFCLLGCGGGEDFSKPPAQIQSQLSKTKSDQSSPQGNESGMPTANSSMGRGTEVLTSDAMDKSPSDKSPSAVTSTAAGLEKTGASRPASPSAPVGTIQETVAETSESPTAGHAGTITASGKSAEAIAEKKSENSGNSVIGNAGGLLGSLKDGGVKPTAGTPSAGVNLSSNATGVALRFGSTALSRMQWLQLVSQLRRQFFMASTLDGSRLAGSSGERTLEVVDTQLAQHSSPAAMSIRSTPISAAANRIPVTGLRGIINSIELANGGQQVLIGTTDGRLLVHSAANSGNWDLLARDLFLFQDEHRRTARLSDTAIVAIRCLPDSRMLTIDADGTCAFWNLADVVLPVTPILEMTVEQSRAMEAEIVPVTPMASFAVSGFQILSIAIADDQHLGAIVTSSEEVFVFRADTGELIETLKADQFAGTQPVCVEFIAEATEILAGLADGRILRRALAGTATVADIDDQGTAVDYESVFVPDVKDQVSSITSIRAIPGTRAIYFGTSDGTVVRYETAHKRIEFSKKRHAAPVIDFLATPFGVLSIGSDRQVQLFDAPVLPNSGSQNSDVTFQLPRDDSLEETVVDDSLPQNAAAVAANTSTRPTRAQVVAKPVEVDLSLTGIRPADAAMALYGHQLRATTESTQQLELRKKILRHRGADSLADSLGNTDADVPDGPPLRAGEAATQMQFSAGNWSRVLLAISNDGTTAAAMHRRVAERTERQAISGALSLYDLTTGTALRHWTEPEPSRRLQLDTLNHVLITTPATRSYWNSTGFAGAAPLRPISASILSADSKHLFLGSAGAHGVAEPALTRITLNDRSETSGHELFESMITAMALSSSGDSLYVSTRERDQVRLIDVSPTTLSIQQEIFRHPFSGRIPASTTDVSQQPKAGTLLIQPSPTDKLMLTWGFYDGGEKLLLWRRSHSEWPQDNVSDITAAEASPDPDAIDEPVKFINQQDGRVAIVTANGLLILNTRRTEVESSIPIPAVSGHRPPCVFSPDGKWLLMGDGEGKVWAASLLNPDRKPLSFSAQTGPIAGLAMSPNGRYLATIGEDNVLRSWRVDGFLKR